MHLCDAWFEGDSDVLATALAIAPVTICLCPPICAGFTQVTCYACMCLHTPFPPSC